MNEIKFKHEDAANDLIQHLIKSVTLYDGVSHRPMGMADALDFIDNLNKLIETKVHLMMVTDLGIEK